VHENGTHKDELSYAGFDRATRQAERAFGIHIPIELVGPFVVPLMDARRQMYDGVDAGKSSFPVCVGTDRFDFNFIVIPSWMSNGAAHRPSTARQYR
jgi:hypothetical protein